MGVFVCKNCSKPSQLSEKNFEFWKCFVFVWSKATAAQKKKVALVQVAETKGD